MKDKFVLFLKGFVLGIANIIPGVSGGTLAVSLGLYDKIITSIGSFFKQTKNNFYFLFPILLGVVVAILSMSKILSVSLEKYQLQTLVFFIGLILGGSHLLIKKAKKEVSIINILALVITFVVVMSLGYLEISTSVSLSNLNIGGYLLLLIVGVVASSTMIIPGISGSFVLMLIGYYEPILNTITNLTSFNNILPSLLILIFFGIGCLIGLVFLSKIIMYLLKKKETLFYYAIIGFVLSSIINIIFMIEPVKHSVGGIIVTIIVFCWGFGISNALSKNNFL